MSYTLYVGTYADGKTEGIRSFSVDFDRERTELLAITPVENPSYLALSPDTNIIYAVGETGENTAQIYAFQQESHGKLTMIDTRPALGGSPCHLAIANDSSFLAVSNYIGGTLILYGLQKDGRFASQEARIFKPDIPEGCVSRMHSAQFSPDGRRIFIANLGLDCLFSFPILQRNYERKDGIAEFIDLANPSVIPLTKGDGPRHTVFHPSGEYLYCVNELSGKISAFKITEDTLECICETDPTEEERSGAAIRFSTVSVDRSFLYTSFRMPSGRISFF